MAAEAPANPQTGDAWYDTTNKFLKIYDGTAWALAMPNRVYVAASDPSAGTTVANGDIWFDTSKNTLYVRVNTAWVPETTRVSVGTAPAAPISGDIYWDSAAGNLKIYDGTAWQTIRIPEYTLSVAAKTGGGATINLNKDNTAVGTANIIAGANSTVSVDDNNNIVVAAKDTTYGISAAVADGVATITLTDNLDNSKSSFVKIAQDDNITLEIGDDGIITIKAVDTVYTVTPVTGDSGVIVRLTDNKDNPTSQDVAFVPGDNISISLTGRNVVIGVNTVSTIGSDTPEGAIANVGAIMKYVAGGIAASDAMVFCGTIGAADKNPTVTELPTNPAVGDTYKVVSDGTYSTLTARIGDIIIYAKDLGWVLVPSGDDGNVYHANDLENGQVVVGAGTASVKTLSAGANNQILRMKDGIAAWTDETAESQLTVATPETDTAADTTVVTGIGVDGHEIIPKKKNVLGKKDIKVTNGNDGINVSITYTKNNIATDLNSDTDVLILNGGTASTVL